MVEGSLCEGELRTVEMLIEELSWGSEEVLSGEGSSELDGL